MAEHTDTRHVEHQITVFAPADTVYELIADVTHWPRVFPPTVHIEHEQLSESEERIRLWATANGAVNAPKSTAELGSDRTDLMLTFEDTVQIAGSARDVYEFIYDATQWVHRLPHVARVSLQEDTPNIQVLDMDTQAPNGPVHTTTSVRICFPEKEIIYKQIVLPALMTVHTGRWLLQENTQGVAVTSQHTIVIKPSAVARNFVRTALSTNSLATLDHARSFAEHRSRERASRVAQGS